MGFIRDHHISHEAFVKVRQILNATLMVDDVVDKKRHLGEKVVVLRFILKKTYDHIKWGSLIHGLKRKGFWAEMGIFDLCILIIG